MSEAHDDFYLRYYVGHTTKENGHEFMEVELTPSGKLRYVNNSNYKSDTEILKEVYVSPAVVEELRRIVDQSEITRVDDSSWEQVSVTRKFQVKCTILCSVSLITSILVCPHYIQANRGNAQTRA